MNTSGENLDRENEEMPASTNPIAEEIELRLATDVQAELGLGTSQFHNYRRHLRLNTYKRGKKAYFDRGQYEAIRSLYSHVQEGGRFLDYPRPEVSGPGDWEEDGDGELLVYSENRPAAPKTGTTKPGYITNIDPNRIKQKASAIAKEQMIAELLGEQLAQNPELLSLEDREEIESYRSHFEATFPKKQYSPQEITALLIVQAPIAEEVELSA